MVWYKELFNQDYDRIYFPTFTEERNRGEADFIEAVLRPPRGGRLMDLACGHGRHVLELARRGYHLIGLDLSSRFTEIGRTSALSADLRDVEFVVGDMREFQFPLPFDSIYCYFTSFGYFSDQENLQVLGKVAQALKPAGRFLLETVNRDWTIHKVEHQPRRWEEPEPDFFMLEDINFNAHTSRIHTTRIIFDHGRRRAVEYDIKLYTHAELEDMLEEVGLGIVSTYGNKDFSPYAVSSPRMAVVSEKKG